MPTSNGSVSNTSSTPPAQHRFRDIFLRTIRAYTFHTPIAKGKYRLFQAALQLVKDKPTSIGAQAKDGRRFISDLTTGMEEMVFFLGEYEPFISSIAERLVRKGDICLDVGANFGWYSTLMARHAGTEGQVHSFEPVPKTFAQLERNIELLSDAAKVTINNLALGDRDAVLKINFFDDLTSGHASFAADDSHPSATFDCEMTTLDKYLLNRNIGDVAFVKVDIEGAEMMFLQGAESLFSQHEEPIFLMEMALAQTSRFGYVPDDLIKFIGERGNYDFYKVDEVKRRLQLIEGFPSDDIGANVFCIPATAADRTRPVIAEYL